MPSNSRRAGHVTRTGTGAPPSRPSMRISVPTETAPREQRVALAPDSVARLIKQQKIDVVVPRGAGLRPGFRDDAYESAGATLVADAGAAFGGEAEIIAKVQPPSPD